MENVGEGVDVSRPPEINLLILSCKARPFASSENESSDFVSGSTSSTNVSELVWLNVGVRGFANVPRVRVGEPSRRELGRSGTGDRTRGRPTRALGVPIGASDWRGFGPGSPAADGRIEALGVVCTEVTALVGERVGLVEPPLGGPGVCPAAANCFALRSAYLLAREPSVIFEGMGVLKAMLLPRRLEDRPG